MNIIKKISYYAKNQPIKDMFIYYGEDLMIKKIYNYCEFNIGITKLAQMLINNIYSKQVILVYPPGLEFLLAFFACLKAGIIPIPVYPPDPNNLKKDLILFNNIVKDSGVEYALTSSDYNWASTLGTIKSLFYYQWPTLTWIVTDTLEYKAEYANTFLPEISNSDIAFIQYTSGSISLPKKIIIRHRNLNHNLNMIQKAIDNNEKSVDVSWLPQYHDMGLIGSRLCTVAFGGTGIYISPVTFIKNPIFFLELVSQYKATHLQGPNFMYAYMARKWNDLEFKPNINLSSLYHIFNAAESINYSDYMKFYETFSKYGLNKSALATGYGLAESVVYVTDTGHNGKRGAQVLMVNKEKLLSKNIIEICDNSDKIIVGCGRPPPDFGVDIKIVKNNLELEDLCVGEIYISSDSIPPENLLFYINDRKYLKTGDLGFVYNNELFITGRDNDLIIINGKNYYPQDFEWLISQKDLVKKGSVAVFQDNKKIIGIFELKQTYSDVTYHYLVNTLKKELFNTFGIYVELFIVDSKNIIKTTSGKISRQKCKMNYKEMTILYPN